MLHFICQEDNDKKYSHLHINPSLHSLLFPGKLPEDKIKEMAKQVIKDLKTTEFSQFEYFDDIVNFKKILKSGELELVYQPIVEAENHQTIYYEMLLRVKNKDGNYACTGQLIKHAELNGFIELVDIAILQQAEQKLKNNDQLKLSINISASSIKHPEWLAYFRKLSAQNLTKRLVIEITESSNNRDIFDLINFCQTVRELGGIIALDDFATCYSTFHELIQIKPDIVKLDGSYINNIEKNQIYQKFIKFLVDLKNDIPFKLVAEFVDNNNKAHILKELGVDYLQGYLFPTKDKL